MVAGLHAMQESCQAYRHSDDVIVKSYLPPAFNCNIEICFTFLSQKKRVFYFDFLLTYKFVDSSDVVKLFMKQAVYLSSSNNKEDRFLN